MSEQLKPCPFCGSCNIGSSYIVTYSVDSSYDVFGCKDCGARFENGDADEWNTRTEDTALSAKDARIAELELEREGDQRAKKELAKLLGCEEPRWSSMILAATRSEDGREVPEVVEFHWPEYHAEGMGCGLEDRGIRDRYEAMQHGWDCALDRCAEAIPDEPLMTVAQHERILKAKDAEIARLREARDRYCELWNRAGSMVAAMPAPQVGGDEREQFEAWMHTFDLPPQLEGEVFNDENYMDADCFGQFVYDEHSTQRCWAAWQARAALAPVASQVAGDEETERQKAIVGFAKTFPMTSESAASGNSYDIELRRYYLCGWDDRAALAPAAVVMPERKPHGKAYWEDGYNAALDEVARLNRRAIPAGLLERVASPWMDDEELTINRHVAINELRALLGKED